MKTIRIVLLALLLAGPARAGSSTFNVRDYGAAGDGKTLDRQAINKAIEACAAAGGGQVLFPPGQYLTGTIRLRSNVTLVVEAGARIIGTSDLDQYENFNPPGSTPLASRNRWHRALVLGVDVENVAITGRGIIDGAKVFDARGEERLRGPHCILFGNSKHIALRDISIQDAANYAVMLEFTSHVEVRGVKITGGWDGVHFRGWKGNPCRDVSITDCEFYTGDDCIAGWFWEDTLIARCIINSSCNGIRLIGPAKNLIIHDCLFFGPGKFEHRTSRDKHRTNMLAGLCLQPGAWDPTQGAMEDVKISRITMHDVTTPLHLSLKPGNTADRIVISNLTATGAYRAAASIESWAEAPIQHITLRDVDLEFAGGGTAEQAKMAVNAPPVDARPLPAWGLYARNIKKLDLQNVRLRLSREDQRPAVIVQDVESLDLEAPGGELRMATASCTGVRVDERQQVIAALANGPAAGLAKVELEVDGRKVIRWVWLGAEEKRDLAIGGIALGPGKHTLRCGAVTREVSIEADGR